MDKRLEASILFSSSRLLQKTMTFKSEVLSYMKPVRNSKMIFHSNS